jgi:hypothetical protein
MADFSGTNFKVEKVAEPEPITEQEEVYTPSKGLASQPYPFDEPTDQRESPSNPALVHEESETGLTASQAGAPTQQEDAVVEQATNVAQYETPLPVIYAPPPTVTNRREALALSESYKEELKPVLERMKAVKEAVECGLKGEAKKIAYIIQWTEKYLAD